MRLVGQPVHLSRADEALRSAAPTPASTAQRFWAELGYDTAAIEELRRGGVI